jgi:hypothetical protein
MVDFSVPNLCGASLELNDVLSKLSDAKADATAKLDEAASTAAAAFGEAQNELAGLKNKLQSIEIPTLPKLNLQAEITSLLSQVPGSLSYISALAKIKSEFGSDLITKGLELESLVTDAAAAILGGGNVCAIAPNLEKVSGSLVAAIEKPAAVKQAAAKAVTEASSKVWQNPDVEAKVEDVKKKITAYAVTSTPPTEDTGAYKVITSTKKISTPAGVVNAAEAGTGKNVVAKGGILNKRSTISEKFSASMITNLGKDGTFKRNNWKTTLKHEPMGKIIITIHPTAAAIKKYSWFLEDDPDSKEYSVQGRFYRSDFGIHAYTWINTAGPGSTGSASVKINGKEINFESPFDWGPIDHPGDIDSGGNTFNRDASGEKSISLGGPDAFRVWGRYHSTVTTDDKKFFSNFLLDSAFNKYSKGTAVWIQYEFLDNYDADPMPG